MANYSRILGFDAQQCNGEWQLWKDRVKHRITITQGSIAWTDLSQNVFQSPRCNHLYFHHINSHFQARKKNSCDRCVAKHPLTNMNVGRELINSCDGCCKAASGLIHPCPSEEGTFGRRLEVRGRWELLRAAMNARHQTTSFYLLILKMEAIGLKFPMVALLQNKTEKPAESWIYWAYWGHVKAFEQRSKLWNILNVHFFLFPQKMFNTLQFNSAHIHCYKISHFLGFGVWEHIAVKC